MKTLTVASAVFAAAVIAIPALAQQQPRPPAVPEYPWCLEERTGGRSGGPMPLLCRFNTLEQCRQSKTSPGDACLRNPKLVR